MKDIGIVLVVLILVSGCVANNALNSYLDTKCKETKVNG